MPAAFTMKAPACRAILPNTGTDIDDPTRSAIADPHGTRAYHGGGMLLHLGLPLKIGVDPNGQSLITSGEKT